ncbi:MAG TPA: alcohol dehydrogenase catalytic domain-containing protein [Anaerolineales bacterium]|nr:alcohol dehydrogenase catalytic domain-containing protein [Anaerolineales bacterium]
MNMKAAYVTGPMRIELRESPLPQVSEDGVLVAVKACGVCGSDLRRWREGAHLESDPLIAGHEIAGKVMAVGRQVKEYCVGDRLAIAPDVHCGKCYYCQHGFHNLCNHLHLIGITPGYNGGFAEYIVLTAEVLSGGIVHPIPDGLSYPQAALAEPLSSVLAAHEEAGTTLGDVVVVMGAGPIGCLHITVAKARGAQVILSEPSAVRRQIAKRFEPELIIDPLTQDLLEEVRQITEGRGADIAICANPVAATHTQAVELVRKRGKVLLFGGLPKDSPMTTLDGNRIHYNEISVIGTFSYHPTYHALALETIEHGIVKSEDIITHTFSLDKIDEAFQTASSGEALKVMVQVDE